MDYDSCIYQEVYEILSLMDKKTVMKIPIEILETIKENRNQEYNTQIDKNDIFNTENLNEETIKLLSWIDLNYWNTSENYEKIKRYNINETILDEWRKKERYESIDIFNKPEDNLMSQNIMDNTEQENPNENTTEVSLVQYKENFFNKFKNVILKLLHKKI